jgi:hypothetical protein
MPNHVHNRIEFNSTQEQAYDILSAIKSENRDFDFEKLIPSPLHMYQADTNAEDDEDFPCNWHNWRIQNWNTKWNAYNIKTEYVDDICKIEFNTAWSIPYPIIIAFGNLFKIDFRFVYCEEFDQFYGIEIYKVQENGFIKRTSKRQNKEEDLEMIHEIFGIEKYEEDEIEDETN